MLVMGGMGAGTATEALGGNGPAQTLPNYTTRRICLGGAYALAGNLYLALQYLKEAGRAPLNVFLKQTFQAL